MKGSDIQVPALGADNGSVGARSISVGTRIKGADSGTVGNAGRGAAVARAQPAAAVGGATTAGSAPEADNVQITSAALQMLALEQAVIASPDINVSRVEQIRADLAQNRYQIDSGEITSRLLQLEGDLLAATPPADKAP